MAKEAIFTIDEIEDVVMVVKAKGQNWYVMPLQGSTEEQKVEAKATRIAVVMILLTESGGHAVLSTPISQELFDKLKYKEANYNMSKVKELIDKQPVYVAFEKVMIDYNLHLGWTLTPYLDICNEIIVNEEKFLNWYNKFYKR